MALVSISATLIFAATMLYLAVKDIRERRVPNKAIVFLLALWASWRLTLMLLDADSAASLLMQSAIDLLMALVVLGALILLSWTYERARRRPSMGAGDIKLIAVMTLYLGIAGVMVSMFVACIIGMIYGVNSMLSRKSVGIPFATCLACGSFMELLLV